MSHWLAKLLRAQYFIQCGKVLQARPKLIVDTMFQVRCRQVMCSQCDLWDIYFYQDIFYLQAAMFLFVGFIGSFYIVSNGNISNFLGFVSFSFRFGYNFD